MATTAAPAAVTDNMQVDNTKAIAIPVLMMLTLIIAIFFTRHSLGAAVDAAKDDFRKLILFGGGVICALASIFLLPSPAWHYGCASIVFAYMSTLLCAPGILEKKADLFFLVYSLWFAILIGIPDLWSDGIISSIAHCEQWFTIKTEMCKESWLTYVTLIAIGIIIVNFFSVIALMSLVFTAQDSGYEQVPDSDRVPYQNIDGANANNNHGAYQPQGYQQ